MDGVSLSIGGTLGAAIVAAIVKIYTTRAHAEATKIPQPCDVRQVNDCVSVRECNRRMAALDDRVTRLETKVDKGFGEIGEKLEAMDRKSEERAIALHHKMDAVANSVASVGGKVEIIERQVFKR